MPPRWNSAKKRSGSCRIRPRSRSFGKWFFRTASRDSIPVFGTLLGTHEYFSLSKNIDEVSRNYIYEASDSPDEAYALEEFLFGLTYEELKTVKNRMEKTGKGVFSRKEVAEILGKDGIYLSHETDDPLEVYRFYNHRRKNALSRRYAGSAGPVRTFEENFMAYLLKINS